MKSNFLFLLLLFTYGFVSSQSNTGIGTTSPHASSLLDLTSTDKGFLIPRMTGAQRAAISSPATGLLVYQTDNYGFPLVTTPGFYAYEGSWKRIARREEIPNPTWTSTGSDQFNTNSGGVGIGTAGAPNASSILDVSSVTKGLLFPRMTNAQRTAINSPATGLLVYQTDAVGQNTSGVYFYDGSLWKRVARADELGGGGGGSSGWTIVSDDQYSNLPGNVGIGTSNPTSKFHVVGNILQESGAFNINHATGILQFKNANVNKAFVQLSGNDLRVGANSGNSAGRFIVRLNGTEHMVVDSTGRTGIGTLSPDTKLHVYDGSIKVEHPGSSNGFAHMPAVQFEISIEDEKKGGLRFMRTGSVLASLDYTADADGPNYLRYSGDGSGNRDFIVNNLGRTGINMNGTVFQPVAQLHVRHADNLDALALHSAVYGGTPTIQFYNTSTVGGNALDKRGFIQLADGTDLRLGTNSGNGNGQFIIRMDGTDQVKVNSVGRMGIGLGTTAPLTKLHIDGGDDVNSNPFEGNGYLVLGDGGATNLALDNNEILARNGAGIATLFLQNDGGDLKVGSNNRLLVQDNGNVGIGTGSPLAKLDVNGRLRVVKDSEAIGIDGSAPFIGMYHNGVYKSKIEQSASKLYIQANDELQLNGDRVIVGNYVPNGQNYKMAVNGKVICEELRVELNTNWPDYVFRPEYDLRPLDEVKVFIQKNGHLPEIPTAETVEQEGFDVGEMNRKLLEKVEELTLYVIQLQEQIDELKGAKE